LKPRCNPPRANPVPQSTMKITAGISFDPAAAKRFADPI
jgi:hypothetical protein